MNVIKPQEENERDPINEVEQSLYSRSAYRPAVDDMRLKFRQHRVNVEGDWNGGKQTSSKNQPAPSSGGRMSFLKKMLYVSVMFLFASIGIAFYIFFNGRNIITSDNVNIVVEGPISIGGGQDLPLTINIENKNNTDLRNVSLLVEYPDGTRKTGDLGTELKRTRDPVENIVAGGQTSLKTSAILFGEEGSRKIISISVEYRVKDSNAVLYKRKDYDVSITSSPITMVVRSLKEVNSNQEITLSVDVSSNSNAIMQNILLKAEYPFGFTFLSASPSTSFGNDTWSIGDLKPKAKKTITIKGKLEGQDEEVRVFRFASGIESPKDEKIMGTAFISSATQVLLKKPFIGVDFSIDNNASKEVSVPGGKSIQGTIEWNSNIANNITNVQIEAKITGSIYEKATVSTQNGFYRSGDSTIVWDQYRNQDFKVVRPGQNGSLSFSLKTISTSKSPLVKNPEMQIDISVHGKRLNDSNVPEDVVSTVSKKIRLASDLGLNARVLRNTGPFTNTGPIPPKVDQESTYTIVWGLVNSVNDVQNGKVIAVLPSNIQWLDKVSPEGSDIQYNPIGGEITWNAGNVKSGTGYGTPAKEVSFQVAVTPSLSQIGEPIQLLDISRATADDAYTGARLSVSGRGPLTTRMSSEPQFKEGDGDVVK